MGKAQKTQEEHAVPSPHGHSVQDGPTQAEQLALADIPARIREAKPVVAVIGDHILDGWWSGRTDRLSREAPAPVIDIVHRVYVPGGGANTAMNLAALGARVLSVGLIGDDEPGHRLRSLLADAGVDVSGLICVPGAQTTTKYRIMGAAQILVRIDDTQRTAWPADALERFAEAALNASAHADAEVLCDYGSATLDGPVRSALIARESAPGLTVVDAHDPRRWRQLKPDLVTPNAAETGRVLDFALSDDSDRVATVSEHSERILASTGSSAAVVTLDRDGTVLLRPGIPPYRTWAHPALEKQASGAGDTFVAALTLARCAGVPWEGSVELAQAAADVAVQKSGTCVCSTADLEQRLGGTTDAALSASELVERIAVEREAGHRIILTNGCFDVLHRGHTSYLRQAKQLGDILVVGVNGDESVRRLKGPGRPITPANDRANVLAALSCVDYVTVFETDTATPLIDLLKPDVYTKGGDYTPDMLEETPAVLAYGGQVTILDYVPYQSTTSVVNRIRSTPGQQPVVGGE